MRNKKYSLILAIAGLTLLASCDNAFNALNVPPVEKGYGKVAVIVTNGESSRTAMPIDPATSQPINTATFNNYTYTFKKSGQTEGEVKAPVNGTFTLVLGTYTVTVDAYITLDGQKYTIASATSPEFKVEESTTPITVKVTPLPTNLDTGKFEYNIIYPTGAEVKILSLVRYGSYKPADPASGNLLTETTSNGTKDSLAVDTYVFTFRAEKEGAYVGFVEAVHIYPKMTTKVERTFTELITLSKYGITLSKDGGTPLSGTDTHTFPAVTTGYKAAELPPALTVTITNEGNQATGALTVELGGTNASRFQLSKTSITSIAKDSTDTFTVQPKTGAGANAKPYTATVTVKATDSASAITPQTFTVSFTVNGKDPVYSISLSQTGTYPFPAAQEGYTTAPAALTVTVTNTGNVATGDLTAALSGTDAGNFTLTGGTISSISLNGSTTFTVVPKTGLPAGGATASVYTATVRVSGDNGIAESFIVSFTVNPGAASYGITLSQPASDTYAFGPVALNYAQLTPLTVTVYNTGNRPTGKLSISTGGSNPTYFTLSKTEITDIDKDGSDTFTIVPQGSLTAGDYSTIVTVGAAGGNSNAITAQTFNVSLKVTVPKYGITLDKTGTHTFPAATVGYTAAPTALKVTVTNTGDQATGSLTVSTGGTNAYNFTASSLTPASIPVDGTAEFTVAPITGLTAGTYTATVTVSGTNITSQTFNVSFTVIASGSTVYGISLSETDTYTFPATLVNYPARDPLEVTVTNTGNQATGALTVALGGTNAGSFTLSKTSITGIVVSGTDTFTVTPNTGLSANTYTATVTVSGGNGITATFNVSFTVNSNDPTYSISLSQTATYTFANTTALAVTINNTGNQDTGALLVELSGTGMSAFTLNPANISSIPTTGDKKAYFTVTPNTAGLTPGTPYTATVIVKAATGNSNIIPPQSFGVEYTFPKYGITLSPTTITFGPAAGSPQPAAQEVTVTNPAGNTATGPLTATLSGTNESSFTLTGASIASIAAGDTGKFSVQPKNGLAVGTYTAIITVSNTNIITGNTVTVSFTVTAAAYGINLSETGTYTFTTQPEGYTSAPSQSVTVTNVGNQATGALTAALSGTNVSSFTLTGASITSIAAGGTATFSVAPNTGLSAGVYTATLTVSNTANNITASFDVSFTVTAAGTPVITITTQPAATTTVTAGKISGSLTVAASVTEGATLSYQWYSNSNSSNNTSGTIITGETAASFTIPTTLTAGTYYYYCVVSATGAVSVTSNVVTVTVISKGATINISWNDEADATISSSGSPVVGGTLTLIASLDGATTPYKWTVNGVVDDTQTSSSYTFQYYVKGVYNVSVVVSKGSTPYSATITVTVGD